MVFQTGVEDVEPDHWVNWVFALPGCYAKGRTEQEAIAATPSRILAFYEWLHQHREPDVVPPNSIEVAVAERFRSFPSEVHYMVNAFFEDDQRAASKSEIDQALRFLRYTRNDLRRVVDSLDSEQLHKPIESEVQKNILGIINHVGRAEWWYCDRLGLAFAKEELPADPLELLDRTRRHTELVLASQAGNDAVTERSGERWSVRKIIRRTLWHERSHTEQIVRYLAARATAPGAQ